MKIAVIGARQVGGTTALMLAQKGMGEVALIDVVEGLPQGKALDLAQTGPVLGYDSRLVGSNDYEAIEGAGLVVVTSGVPRKPGMTREDLLETNANIIATVAKEIAVRAPNALILMVANPLDVMCHVAQEVSGFPPERVFGQAGVLDSARFRCFIAEALDVSVEDVQALVLGGHGDAMVPLVSCTTVSGIPLRHLMDEAAIELLVARTRDGGAEIVRLLKTGSAFYAPAASTVQMAESVVRGKRRLLAASALCQGEFGLHDVYVGVPVKLGRNGIEQIVEIPLTEEERAALHRSASVVKENVDLWHQRRAAAQ